MTWIYIERILTREISQIRTKCLKDNNVLILEFDKYGVLKKNIFNKENLNKMHFQKDNENN
jgi:outer membrane protein assembly factor BamE (lipoprotein component of BamABCDE complex)